MSKPCLNRTSESPIAVLYSVKIPNEVLAALRTVAFVFAVEFLILLNSSEENPVVQSRIFLSLIWFSSRRSNSSKDALGCEKNL